MWARGFNHYPTGVRLRPWLIYCCCAWASSMNLTLICPDSCDMELLYIYIYFWWKLTTAPVKHDGKKSQARKCDKFMYVRPSLAIILVYFKTAWHTLVLDKESGIWECRLRNKWLLCSQLLTVWPTAAEKARVPNLENGFVHKCEPSNHLCIPFLLHLVMWTVPFGSNGYTSTHLPSNCKSRIIA